MFLKVDSSAIKRNSPAAFYAADILSICLRQRGVAVAEKATDASPFVITLSVSPFENKNAFEIQRLHNELLFSASGVRGLIYAIGFFLRKSKFRDSCISIPCDLPGFYRPAKTIRGHQLGYRHCSNTYDAWTRTQFLQYELDLMFFGANTVEHIPQTDDISIGALMRSRPNDLLRQVSEDAEKLDLDFSLWIPNDTGDLDAAIKKRKDIFQNVPRINAVFIPGADPGSFPPAELKRHCDAISDVLRETHPNAALWASAQMPHNAKGWGEAFLDEFQHDAAIAGVITGPNHAFEIETLRRRLPDKLPIRFYPDITHNVRCEYPVHFMENDWHYAWATCLSRECVNPRPLEFALLHRRSADYTVGSVSYSDGVNDDVNKAVWSALEWDPAQSVREILADYARLFFYGANISTAVDALLGLELNWNASPLDNPHIESTLLLWERLGKETPALHENWRYLLGLFRALCDSYIRQRMSFETELLKEAEYYIQDGKLDEAEQKLYQDPPQAIQSRRKRIFSLADKLHAIIGIQLSTLRHGASAWERGASLDTIDLPITNVQWMREQFQKAKEDSDPRTFLKNAIARNRVGSDEYYFSFALHGLSALGCKQNGEFYMDFQGDRPDVNNGSLPICLQKVYDHTSLLCSLGGFAFRQDYLLTVTYKKRPHVDTNRHRITANGRLIYEGPQFGGVRNKALSAYTPDGFVCVTYELPATVFCNGCVNLEISEPETGFAIGEFRITKKEDIHFAS